MSVSFSSSVCFLGGFVDVPVDLLQVAKESVTSFILDCESVAWDKEQKKILPFQVLSTRKRKDVEVGEVKVQVCLFAFDLLLFNGRSLLQEPLKVRRDLLREHFLEREGEFEFAKSIESTNVEAIETFLDESIKGNCEGLMVKTLEKEATVGLVDSKKGISLRFPRFIRVRDDKNPEDASNSAFVAELYKAQNLNRQSLEDVVDEEDF